jgi:hypothetical protein
MAWKKSGISSPSGGLNTTSPKTSPGWPLDLAGSLRRTAQPSPNQVTRPRLANGWGAAGEDGVRYGWELLPQIAATGSSESVETWRGQAVRPEPKDTLIASATDLA